jgi:carbamoyl-phosphate synthase large subunit
VNCVCFVDGELGREMLKVLITSVGATGAQNVIKALRKQDTYPVQLIGCDVLAENAGAHLVDKFFTVPPGGDAAFIPALLSICDEVGIDMIIPIMEAELMSISKNGSVLAQFNPVVSDVPTLELCADKKAMYALVSGKGLRVPQSYDHADRIKGPLVVKPRNGTGSVGLEMFDCAPADLFERVENEHLIVQDRIEGQEYTVDCYVGYRTHFVACSPRKRLAIKGGLATKTLVVDHPGLVECCMDVLRVVPIRGACNIQFIEDDNGDLYFIEINPRFGGAYIASMEAGLNAPLFMLNELRGDAIEFKGVRSGILMLRYWNEIFTEYLVRP